MEGWCWVAGMGERQGDCIPGALFVWLCVEVGGGWLPGLVGEVVAAVDGEGVGLVGVVLGIGVVGADADFLFGRQVVDLDGFVGEGVAAGVERYGGAGRMERCQFAEGLQVGPGVGVAGADEVVLEAAGDGAELGRGGSVGDDAVGGWCAGRLWMGLVLRVGVGVGVGDYGVRYWA